MRQSDRGLYHRKPKNDILQEYGPHLHENHFSLIGSDVEPPAFHTKHIFDFEEPEETAHGESKRTFSQLPAQQTSPKPMRQKRRSVVNKPMKGLFHIADMAKLRSDLKVPMSRGLGPAIVGTDQWNLAMSKVNAARDYSARVKEENRILTLRTGSP